MTARIPNAVVQCECIQQAVQTNDSAACTDHAKEGSKKSKPGNKRVKESQDSQGCGRVRWGREDGHYLNAGRWLPTYEHLFFFQIENEVVDTYVYTCILHVSWLPNCVEFAFFFSYSFFNSYIYRLEHKCK